MLVNFTKASEKDNYYTVTVRSSQFRNIFDEAYDSKEIIIYILHRNIQHPVVFRCNRCDGSTFVTKSWPGNLPSPWVGAPLELCVIDVKEIY